MRIALCLEYNGSSFCGFQSQADGCAVQDALERALGAVAADDVTVVAAGRTDAGVHATSQVVHFDTDAARPDTAWVRGVNAHLPEPVAVLWAQPVNETFHARFAARARYYSYLVLNRPQRPGLRSGRVGWYHRPLDVDAMAQAARSLIGTHDFSAFRAAECQAKTPVKTLLALDVARQGDVIRLDFAAHAFLHHMVRNIVGALVCVGSERQPPEWIAELLEARDRTRAAPTFAPDGLYFSGADYDAMHALPPTRREIVLAPF
ncbi:MAG TPA: tRNA pseudouridine(38-40) synthase TruA [Casimicrobiaceae bacterium]|jgi:tRNA pseudouridine38-40 synthase